jgi:hypothetical protein
MREIIIRIEVCPSMNPRFDNTIQNKGLVF